MKIPHSYYIFFVILSIQYFTPIPVLSVIIPNQPNISVTVFTEQYFHGTNVTLYFTNCSSNLHTHATLGGNISSINSRGRCVNLYKTPTCTGEYIVISPGTPIHYDLSAWSGGFFKNVNSIGPCYPRCDPRAVQVEKAPQKNSSGQNYLVTLYDDSGYKGPHTTINLSPEACHLIPLKLKRRISSVKVHGNFCIELHHTWNCEAHHVGSRRFTQLRPSSPKHTDLIHWVGHDNQALAVSLCGFDCNITKNRSVNTTTTSKPSSTHNGTEMRNDTVTIFDDKDAFFNGHFKNFNFSSHHNKCVNLEGDWDGQVNALQPYGHCIVIYDEFNCISTKFGRNLTIFTNTSVSAIPSFLQSHNFDRVVQSLKLCDKPRGNSTVKKGKSEKLVGGVETSAKSIFFIVMFSLVTVSLFSVGLAVLAKKFLHSGFGCGRRGRGSLEHSLMF